MDTKNIIKEYSNGEITVVWKSSICVHSTICWKEATGLPEVFDPRARPWIRVENASTDRIIEQVNKCPSGALSWFRNEAVAEKPQVEANARVEVVPNGPLLVYGHIKIKDQKGNETQNHKVTAFCRCGLSGNKPYCDGSHIQTKVDD